MRLSLRSEKSAFSHLFGLISVFFFLSWRFFFFFFVVRSAIASLRGSNTLAAFDSSRLPTADRQPRSRSSSPVPIGYRVLATCDRNRTGRRWATYRGGGGGTPSRPSCRETAIACARRTHRRLPARRRPRSRRYLPFDSHRGPRARAMAGFDLDRVSTCTYKSIIGTPYRNYRKIRSPTPETFFFSLG